MATKKIAKSVKKTEKIDDVLVGTVDELLSLMGTNAKATVSFDQENDAYVVTIAGGDETGLLIGRKGETLLSIQNILGIMLKQKVGEWHRVVVNVGDYREKEEDYLKNLATSAADRAIETGAPQSLYNLKPGQRRVVHMFLAENPNVTTESVGEGDGRYLVVSAKNANKN